MKDGGRGGVYRKSIYRRVILKTNLERIGAEEVVHASSIASRAP